MLQLVDALRYEPEVCGFDSRWCHWNFSLTQSFRPHYGTGVDSASNKNEYQECFLEVKAAGALGWQPYQLQVSIIFKSGSLNLLEPSGLDQACTELLYLTFCTNSRSQAILKLIGLHSHWAPSAFSYIQQYVYRRSFSYRQGYDLHYRHQRHYHFLY